MTKLPMYYPYETSLLRSLDLYVRLYKASVDLEVSDMTGCIDAFRP